MERQKDRTQKYNEIRNDRETGRQKDRKTMKLGMKEKQEDRTQKNNEIRNDRKTDRQCSRKTTK
jgi:hypothetical protein